MELLNHSPAMPGLALTPYTNEAAAQLLMLADKDGSTMKAEHTGLLLSKLAHMGVRVSLDVKNATAWAAWMLMGRWVLRSVTGASGVSAWAAARLLFRYLERQFFDDAAEPLSVPWGVTARPEPFESCRLFSDGSVMDDRALETNEPSPAEQVKMLEEAKDVKHTTHVAGRGRNDAEPVERGTAWWKDFMRTCVAVHHSPEPELLMVLWAQVDTAKAPLSSGVSHQLQFIVAIRCAPSTRRLGERILMKRIAEVIGVQVKPEMARLPSPSTEKAPPPGVVIADEIVPAPVASSSPSPERDGIPMFESPTLALFKFEHLPKVLQKVSAPFAALAQQINDAFALNWGSFVRQVAEKQGKPLEEFMPAVWRPATLMGPPALHLAYLQTEQALTDLLRAKDAAVRAALALTGKV